MVLFLQKSEVFRELISTPCREVIYVSLNPPWCPEAVFVLVKGPILPGVCVCVLCVRSVCIYVCLCLSVCLRICVLSVCICIYVCVLFLYICTVCVCVCVSLGVCLCRVQCVCWCAVAVTRSWYLLMVLHAGTFYYYHYISKSNCSGPRTKNCGSLASFARDSCRPLWQLY
jgi:hypothetical protein